LALAGWTAGCSVEDDGDATTFATGGSTVTAEGDTGDGETTGGETGSGTGTESSQSGSTSDSGEESTSTESSTGGFVPPTDETEGGGGAYAPCPGGSCMNGEACLQGEGPNEGKAYCAEVCSPAGDPTSCPDAPDGDAVPSCIDVNDGMGGANTSYCALDCTGGKTCPAGQSCVNETDANGPIQICL
jgi:hypothetical protein